MGLLSFRSIVAIALFFAVVALAAPLIEERAATVDVTPVVGAINKVTQSVTKVLDIVNKINTGAGTKAVEVITSLGNTINDVTALIGAIAVAAIKKAVGVATEDVDKIKAALASLLEVTRKLALGLVNPALTAVVKAEGDSVILLKTVVGGLVVVLNAALSSLTSLLGTTAGTVDDDVQALKSLLNNLKDYLVSNKFDTNV